MCGLIDLGWEARQDKANQILSSTEWKQQLCNDLVGLSFRDLEKILSSIASERQKREDSRNEKLKIENGKAHRHRNGSRSRPTTVDSDSNGNLATSSPKLPRRSLAEILAQVYSPRVSEIGLFGDGDDALVRFYRQKGSERCDSVFPGSDFSDDMSEKSTG